MSSRAQARMYSVGTQIHTTPSDYDIFGFKSRQRQTEARQQTDLEKEIMDLQQKHDEAMAAIQKRTAEELYRSKQITDLMAKDGVPDTDANRKATAEKYSPLIIDNLVKKAQQQSQVADLQGNYLKTPQAQQAASFGMAGSLTGINPNNITTTAPASVSTIPGMITPSGGVSGPIVQTGGTQKQGIQMYGGFKDKSGNIVGQQALPYNEQSAGSVKFPVDQSLKNQLADTSGVSTTPVLNQGGVINSQAGSNNMNPYDQDYMNQGNSSNPTSTSGIRTTPPAQVTPAFQPPNSPFGSNFQTMDPMALQALIQSLYPNQQPQIDPRQLMAPQYPGLTLSR